MLINAETKLNGAQIVIKQLIAHGVNTVFGYPGGAVLTLYDELYKNSERINHVLTAHEQGAAHAADGYARVSGKTGVVIATSGPGATNLVTGIANAYLDSIPIVAITGNVPVPLLGKDSFQEVDIVSITKTMVKYNYIVRDVNELEGVLKEAFRVANEGRRGPVLVDIPKNIQSDIADSLDDNAVLADAVSGGDADDCRSKSLDEIAEVINRSERAFIYAGGGIISSGAEKELRLLSEKLSAPVGLSMMGLSALPNNYPLNLGMCGMHGRYASSMAKSECDVLLVLGARFSDRATGNVVEYSQDKTIIHIDIDDSEFGKNVTPHFSLCGDVKRILVELLKKLNPDEHIKKHSEKWLSRINALKQIEAESENCEFAPKEVIQTVRRFCGDDTVVATDVGQHQMWVMQYYKLGKSRTLLTSGGLGAMGFGLGAAIGGCIANGRKRTVLFTGDGSFGMNLIELATAVSQKLPIIIVILNNSSLGLPRQWQTTFYGGRYSQSDLTGRKTDFCALAEAFGAKGYSADDMSTLNEVLESVCCLADNQPVVIDVKIEPNEIVLPMIPPGGSIKDIITK
ncbi:MAG: biosynthetic-type acetolactate synthase large subunit [Oscillospiraceae bacterium]|nr:biosynthetic-type acetolactate synthase large subunit [Oscillospiraceae bacterium]